MRKIVFLPVFLFITSIARAQPAVQDFDMEVTADMLSWKSERQLDNKLRTSKVLKKWKEDFAEEHLAFAELDINGDGIKEIIIAGSDFPSRGRGFIILKKANASWRNIMQWRGGFIFHRNTEPAYSLHVFENSVGDMYYLKMNYVKGSYEKAFLTLLPRTIYNENFLILWKSLNGLNIFK